MKYKKREGRALRLCPIESRRAKGEWKGTVPICRPALMVYRLGRASGSNVEQRAPVGYPELFHLEAARIRTY